MIKKLNKSLLLMLSAVVVITNTSISTMATTVSDNNLVVEQATLDNETIEQSEILSEPVDNNGGSDAIKAETGNRYSDAFTQDAIQVEEGQALTTLFDWEKLDDNIPELFLELVSFKTDASNGDYFYKLNFVNNSVPRSAKFYLFDEYQLLLKIDPKWDNDIDEATQYNPILKLDKNKTYYVVMMCDYNEANDLSRMTFSYNKILDDCRDDVSQSTLLSLNKQYEYTLNGYNDMDVFKITTDSRPAFYNVYLLNTSIANSTEFIIYDSNLEIIDKGENTLGIGQAYQKTISLDANKVYYITVAVSKSKSAGDTNNVGNYIMKFTTKLDDYTDTMSSAKLVSIGKEYRGSFQSDEDYDRLTFKSGNLSSYYIHVNNLNKAGNIQCLVKDAYDKTLTSIKLENGINKISQLNSKYLDTHTQYYILLSGTEDVNYSFKILPVQHKIIYKLNKGKNHASNEAVYTETLGCKLYNPTRKGYTFAGWYTDSNFSDKNKITSIDKEKKEDITVYAKWNKVKVSKVTVKSLKAKSKSSITLKYKKVSSIDGYEVQYSTSKKFKSAKKVQLSNKKTSTTIKKLKKNKTYYVRVRAYKKDSTGAKVYGKWSTTKKIKTKKK